MQLVGAEASDEQRVGGDPAFAAVITVRARRDEPVAPLLGFLEPCWGLRPLPWAVPGQKRVLVQVDDEAALRRLSQEALRHRRVLGCIDRLWTTTAGGPIQVRPRLPARSAQDLALLHTTGANRLASAIAAVPETGREVTGRPNRVAVVTDGSCVRGLGAVGPLAALPIAEGKAALFAQLADIDAVPICLNTATTDEVVAVVRALAPAFGAISLEAIAAPGCFDIERRLQDELDIPVFHDDQHATAVVIVAALRNALRVVSKSLATAHIVVLGTSTTGAVLTRLVRRAGSGTVTRWFPDAEPDTGRPASHLRPARLTGPRRVHGGPAAVLAGTDAVVDLSDPGLLTPQLVTVMAARPVVFTLSSPEPRWHPDLLADRAAVIATAHPEHPNYLTNALAFPGLTRGALNSRAPRITTAMHLAAADVLAGLVGDNLLGAHRLLPDILDPQVVETVAAAVAAVESSRRRAPHQPTADGQGDR
ncbi:NAD-dependent malic enzyme [Actinoplanes sp. ATCC 53533]|uniref:NAD(P)-dependent malic enzyme n=1 Tax=Actinoplanes sp. ATCC 53533 TaxID=1288362 RepID=UPI000F7B01A0|nr:malic enzyme-like NAD(P)-binding protein [Actinoplanes sp. ATCC 53533]RSM68063.1 NAD-dependent malic enzyme [Actinoplanes sp. ATCC 53533]